MQRPTTRVRRVTAARLLAVALGALLLAACAGAPRPAAEADSGEALAPPPASARFRDASLAPSERAADLLGYMTLEEKLGQMIQIDRQFLASDAHIARYALGSLLSGGGSVPTPNTPEAWADMIDGYQRHALETRLAIPLLYGTDAVHGHSNMVGATIFPHNIGLGATTNPELVEEIARITAIEAAAVGVNWSFSPSVGVPQDIRWGRTYEGFSEDAGIAALLGAAYVRGMQGGAPGGEWPPAVLGRRETILATIKHFIGDGATAGGRDQGDAPFPLDVIVERFGEPYRAGIAAGAGSVMASYNSIMGVKVHGIGEALTDVLRGEMAFPGLLVSDWAAVRQLQGGAMAQVAMAVNAGIDMIMVPDDYVQTLLQLKGAVLTEAIPEARIDEAVLRILEIKFALGLFEDPFARRELIELIGSEDHRAVARRAVRESLVLLRNEGGVLPLREGNLTLMVAGSRADDIGSQSGGWTLTWQGATGNAVPGTSILDSLTERAAASGGELVVLTRPDGRLRADDPEPDIVLVVIGEDPYAEMEGDSATLALPRGDLSVFDRAAAVGAPLVTILLTGRPMILDAIAEHSDALVAAWLPGSEGAGVVDVLLGDAPVTGTLPFTWPATIEAVPVQTAEPSAGVLYPRGYGLRYPVVNSNTSGER